MNHILFMTAAFLVAISILIAVHEFGHFWVAKKLGVKVLRYSIGFGRPLWKRTFGADRTEYVIAALPLGGYVKMLDEREGPVPQDEAHRAFNRQPVMTRIAIVAAGPIFNLLFAVVAYWGMYTIGMDDVKPVIGQVYAESPASQAGLEKDDQILSIQGEATPINSIASEQLILAALEKRTVTLQVKKSSGVTEDVNLDLTHFNDATEPKNFFREIGIRMWMPKIPVIIDQISKDSSAMHAGLKTGDHILQIDKKPMQDWRDLVKYVQAHAGKKIDLLVERDGYRKTFQTTLSTVEVKGKPVGRLGVTPAAIKIPDDMIVHYQYPFLKALPKSIQATVDKTIMSLQLFVKLVSGDISVKNISGPIGIAQSAGASASAGLPWFLGFIAFVSINLGILNLLPIPILDGGHLMYYCIEAVKGSPVSDAVQEFGQRIGIALLLTLMMLAFYNDIARLFK